MDWISIGLAGLSGAVAAAMASLLVRNPKEKRAAYTVVVVICFVVLQGLSREFIFPDLNAWNQARKAESALLEIPAFQAIKQYDPTTYKILLSDLKGSLREGLDESQVIGMVRGHIAGLVQRRLPSASDEAVVSYINVMVTEIREIGSHGGDLCYRFLFPQQSAPVGWHKYFSKQTQEADLAALAQVIRTAAENPQTIPREADVMPTLEPIFVDLANEYGNDIDMLQNPSAPTVDRAKICSMTADLYSRILQLSKHESSKVLRFLLSQNVLTPRASPNAETGKTYPNIGEYSLARCEFIAQLTEKAAQFRDTGGSRQQFLDIIQQASLDDEEKVKEDKFALAQTAAIMAYENPSLSPKQIFEAMMTVCTNEYIMKVAENQGQTIGGMRHCAIDSLQHEALLEEVFQLLTTDATTLAAARERMRQAMERTIGLLTAFRNNRGGSTEDYRRIFCTQEVRDSFLKDTRTLASAKKEILERNAKDKPNP